ncbi:MAG: RDD family protein [Candidatus Hodarchaeales archaeon]
MSSQQALLRKTAPCMDRCIASIIDGFLSCIPCYPLWKDGIRDGQSFGKGMMGLRVVKFSTGRPATITDSCLRNCFSCCEPLLLITSGRRRFGDYVAGTIVIKDA